MWHFDELSQYDTLTKEGGLFTEYINTFLKMKQEADGWPTDCNTPEERTVYINTYLEKEGIQLENIEKNEGMRAMAKMMLNSFWGKFGQRNNLPHKEIITCPGELMHHLQDDSKECTVNRIDEESIELTWYHKEHFVDTGCNKNIFIAAYTTAQARLKLYSYLKGLKERVLYFDTDSIIYVSREGDYDPPVGRFLGDMTDELEKPYGRRELHHPFCIRRTKELCL